VKEEVTNRISEGRSKQQTWCRYMKQSYLVKVEPTNEQFEEATILCEVGSLGEFLGLKLSS